MVEAEKERFQRIVTEKSDVAVYIANTLLRMRKYSRNPGVTAKGLCDIAKAANLFNKSGVVFLTPEESLETWRFLIFFCASPVGKEAIAKAKKFPRYSSVA